MKRSLASVLLFAVAGLMLAGLAVAEDDAYSYVGLKKCKMCHKSDKSGGQFGIWEKSPHAGAYANLTSDAGKAKAAELGVKDPTSSDKCLSCHVTGHGVAAELGAAKLAHEEGVTCEACHGPGSGYWKKKTMAAITAGTQDGAAVGLISPDENMCIGCHKADNPGHSGEFDFAEAVKKIAHPVPAE